jgi:hypothetical protein
VNSTENFQVKELSNIRLIVIALSEHLGFKSDAYVGEPLLKLFSKSGWPTSRIASEISNLIESQQ